jgi:hypothetical protein
MSLASSNASERTRERRAARLPLEAAARSLEAVAAMLSRYPRPSNDPNGRLLLDVMEHAKAASRAAYAALADLTK